MSTESITVQVPASSGNVGPGYDCMGLGIALYNRLTLGRGEDCGGGGMSAPAHPMVEESAAAFFARAGGRPFRFDWSIDGDVPTTRGLGSSVTLRLGILKALNEFNETPLSDFELFQLCTELEGHPDNAGPGVFGGFVLSNAQGRMFRYPIDERLKLILLIPDYEVATREARKLLPETIPHREAALNMANACTVTACFAGGEYEKLEGALRDYLHQGYRLPLVPGLEETIEAGIAAGALGGFLSGSGSTIACLSVNADATSAIGEAMKAANPHGSAAQVVTTVADNEGATVVARGS